MVYSRVSNHRPRARASGDRRSISRPAPLSRSLGSSGVRVSGGGLSVTSVAAPRPLANGRGAARIPATRTAGDPRGSVRIPAPLPKPLPARTVRERTQQAVRLALPNGATVNGALGRAAGAALRLGGAMHHHAVAEELAGVAAQLDTSMNQILSALEWANNALKGDLGPMVINPQFNSGQVTRVPLPQVWSATGFGSFRKNALHTDPNGGDRTQITHTPVGPQPTYHSAWGGPATGSEIVPDVLPSGHVVYTPISPTTRSSSGLVSRTYRRSLHWYQNNTGLNQPTYVAGPMVWNQPLGAPLPIGWPAGMPLSRPNRAPAAVRPRRVEEVAIDVHPEAGHVFVYPARPRKAGPRGKERKGYGRWSSAATVVFYVWEMTRDVKDWVRIILANTATAPKSIVYSKALKDQLLWIATHPDQIILHGDFPSMLADLVGWAIDERFGAWLGEKQKQANRGIAGDRNTIDMRVGVDGWYNPPANSLGTLASDMIKAFL